MAETELRAPSWRGMTTRCGAEMPRYGARCWRRPGHKDSCRSQEAIENQNVAHRKWTAPLRASESRAYRRRLTEDQLVAAYSMGTDE